jgi:hypothetical protein
VDVVLAVSVAVCAVELLIVTDVGARLQVTGLEALDGDVVTAQVSATVPVNELDGVTVIVEVLPEVAPGLLTLMAPLLERVKSEEPIGSQKPLQPTRSNGAISANPKNFFKPIPLLRNAHSSTRKSTLRTCSQNSLFGAVSKPGVSFCPY